MIMNLYPEEHKIQFYILSLKTGQAGKGHLGNHPDNCSLLASYVTASEYCAPYDFDLGTAILTLKETSYFNPGKPMMEWVLWLVCWALTACEIKKKNWKDNPKQFKD